MPDGYKEGDDDNWKSRAVCKLCSSELSMGHTESKFQTTSNLRNHLRKRHVDEFLEAEKTEELSLLHVAKKTKQKQLTLSDGQTWEQKWKIDSPQAIAVHKAVMNVIVADMQPLSIVEDVGFKRLIHQSWPKYQMPSRKFFGDKLVILDGLIRTRVQSRIPNEGWLSFGTDGWSSRNAEYSYQSLTCYWLNDECCLDSAVLEVSEIHGRHTADNLLKIFNEMLDKWKINVDRVHTVVTDSGGNIVKVGLLYNVQM